MKHVWQSPKMDLIPTMDEDVLTASTIDASSSNDSNKFSTNVKVKVNI